MKRKTCAILAALFALSSCAAPAPITPDAPPPSETTEGSASAETSRSEKPTETTSTKPETTAPAATSDSSADGTVTEVGSATAETTAATDPVTTTTTKSAETTTTATTTATTTTATTTAASTSATTTSAKPVTTAVTTRPTATVAETYEMGDRRGSLYDSDSVFAEADDFIAEAPSADSVSGGAISPGSADGAHFDEAASDFTYEYTSDCEYGGDVYDYVYPCPEQPPAARAGLLTGGEWRDSENFDFWKNLIGQRSEWSELSRKWRLSTVDRIAVRVEADGKPAENVTVKLFAGKTKLWEAVTDNRGNAYLYKTLDEKSPAPTRITAERGGKELALVEYREGDTCTLTLSEKVPRAKGLDLMFVIDTTGSMGDELRYLQAELEGVIERIAEEKQVSARLGLTFYRDEGDEYTVRGCNFTDEIRRAVEIMNEQSSDGGGDYPEAVEKALACAISDQSWNEESVKLLFLVLDAPPHDTEENADTLRALLAEAAQKGIRIIPVASSGVDTETEFLCRSFALATGGTYTFLTDHSGIGLSHLEPTIGSYRVEKLNDLLARIIESYLEH